MIPNRAKLHEKFVKAKLSGVADACKELFEDVVQNYAQAPQAPVSRGFTPVVDPTMADVPESAAEPIMLSPEDVADVQHYAETEKIDMVQDGGWDKALAGWYKKKKPSAA